MNKSTLKTNLPIILAFAIPVLMIIVVALAVYLPSLFLKPQYDFVYATQSGKGISTYSGALYVVENGKIKVECLNAYRLPTIKGEPELPVTDTGECTANNSDAGTLYLHDVQTNASKELSFADAQAMSFNNHPISPDGFEVVGSNYARDLFPLVSTPSSYGTKYLKSKYGSKKLNLQLSTDMYYGFTFVGWVEAQ